MSMLKRLILNLNHHFHPKIYTAKGITQRLDVIVALEWRKRRESTSNITDKH